MVPRAPRRTLALASVVLLLGLGAMPVRANIIFSTFVPNPPGAPIGFAYAGNKFVGSIQTDGTGVLYSTDLSGGNVQPFAPGVSLTSNPASEHFVASSLGLGGFPSRDIYVAAGNTVVHINNAGTVSNTFVSGLNGSVRGILFDAIGTFGNNMLVTTNAGGVYRVTSAGVATLLASTGEDTEGLDVAPLGSAGAFSGSLFVASEGSGNIRAITPLGAITVVANVPSAEELTFVPLNLGASGDPAEGFYGANYSVNVQKAGVSQFTGLLGDIIVTGETTHNVTDLHFNGTSFVSSQAGAFPNQPEDGIFVTAAIVQGPPSPAVTVPEPATLILWGVGLLGTAVARIRRYHRCKS
jgi:hypothetical protein